MVAFVANIFVKVEATLDVAVTKPVVSCPTEEEEIYIFTNCAKEENRFVVVAFVILPFVPESNVENRFVVVAAVPVAFTKVKFWSVEEPVARSVEKERLVVAVKKPTVSEPIVEEEIYACTIDA